MCKRRENTYFHKVSCISKGDPNTVIVFFLFFQLCSFTASSNFSTPPNRGGFCVQGPQGRNGMPGKNGIPGRDGKNGTPGRDGE